MRRKQRQGEVVMKEKLCEVIRLRDTGRSQVEIAQATGLAHSTVSDYLRRISAHSVTYQEQGDATSLSANLFAASAYIS